MTSKGPRPLRGRAASVPADLGDGFAALYKCAALGIATLSPAGRFLASNEALQRFLGYDERELAARNFDEITYPEDVGACRDLFERLQRGAIDHFEMEKRYVRKDGEIVWALVIVAAVRRGGKLHHTIGVAMDITKRKRAQALLAESEKRHRALYKSTQRGVAQLNQFLALVSRELKAPLSLLQLRIELLSQAVSRASLPPAVGRELAPILEGTLPDVARFSRLVEGLVDLSLIAAGPLPLHRAPMSLSAAVRAAVADVRKEPERGLFAPVLEIKGDAQGRWDQFRVEQVLRALLSNAAKFGSGKPVTVEVRRGGRTASVSVADLGIGIARKEQELLFDRLGPARAGGAAGGAGLSLYLAGKIALAHGGTLKARSSPGKGLTFTLELPI